MPTTLAVPAANRQLVLLDSRATPNLVTRGAGMSSLLKRHRTLRKGHKSGADGEAVFSTYIPVNGRSAQYQGCHTMREIFQNAWLVLSGLIPFVPHDGPLPQAPRVPAVDSSYRGPFTHGGAWSEAFQSARTLVSEMTVEEKVRHV